jgi:hypothetical protein
MKLHGNAALGPKGRLRMVRRVVEENWLLAAAAEAAGVSERTCWKWVSRFRADGEAGLVDRSSAPRSVPRRTEDERISAIVALCKLRLTGQDIALALGMPASTVSGILTRVGLGKLSRLEPSESVSRYERERPGELIHIDVKKLGRINQVGRRVSGDRRKANRTRGAGWEFVHVCIDDATRLAYVEVLDDEKASTAVAFLRRATSFYRSHGIHVQRLRPTTAPLTSRPCTRLRAELSGSGTSAHAPTDPRPTARPSASSAPCSAAGPTARSTATAASETPLSPAGSTSTITADHTARSTANPQQLASTS